MHPTRWGDPARAAALPGTVRGLVELVFPVADRTVPDDAAVSLPAAGLDDAVLADLAGVVGAGHVLTDARSRRLRTRGKSTPDLLRARAGDLSDAPDAVVRPGDHDEVQAVLEAASRHRVAVVPFGGGTSVVGGLVARRDGYAGVVSLDLVRMKRLLAVDPVSMTATLEPGLRGPEAEALLAEHRMTLGHFPQSFEFATIGGFAATRSSGQSSAGYGRFDALVVGLVVATPTGPVQLGHAPASAAGPDLRQVFMGSEGAFGVITAVTVRVRTLPETTHYEGWRWPSFDAGAAAMRTLAQAQLWPTVLRLSDEKETALNLADPDFVGGLADGHSGGPAGGCLMIVGFEGTPAAVDARRAAVSGVLTDLGGEPAGEGPGQKWSAGRFDAPYLRDSMLDAGVLVETLETATYWSHLRGTYDAVSAALLGSLGDPVLVLCHVSHVYETGASLYFTVAAPEGEDGLARWREAKRAAMGAIVDSGATITHHHAVGTDHRPWLEDEIGRVGIDVLRAVKAAVDPHGILNPGVLVP
jgi:alkyldihydroxyacetonephosphate synthase